MLKRKMKTNIVNMMSVCAALFSTAETKSLDQLPQIEFDGFQSQDQKTLQDSTIQFLQALGADFSALAGPIVYVNIYGGPQYADGKIKAKFPMIKETMDPQTEQIVTQTKTANESVTIHLHELTHQLFEKYIESKYLKTKPEVFWAFFTAVDMNHEGLSKQLIEETKKYSRTPLKTTEEIFEVFSKFPSYTLSINEFLADTLPVLFAKDPDAIFKSIDFGDNSYHYRRYVIQISAADLEKIFRDEYDLTFISKVFIWQEVYARYQAGTLGKISFGELATRIFSAAISAAADLTKDFTTYDKKAMRDPVILNQKIIESLCKEFKIQPCNSTPIKPK